jgi:hypothetical protein
VGASKNFDRVLEILEIIAEYYENLELLLKELLCIEDAPKSKEEIEAYLQAVSKCLIYREFDYDNVFPEVSYGEIVKKLYPLVKKIFEKNPNKTILITKDVRKGRIGIHPFLIRFYDEFELDEKFSREIDVIVTYNPIQIKFNGIELYLPLDATLSSLYDPYIALNPEDFSHFSPLLTTNKKLRINYTITTNNQAVWIDIKRKEEEKKLKVITKIPELYLEIKEDAGELERLSGSPYSHYLEVKLKRDELIEKLEELNLENEEFYKLLQKTKEIDERFKENLPLIEGGKEYVLLYTTAARMIENYVERREREVARIREKIIEKMSE